MILITGATGFIGRHLLKGMINRYGKENLVALTSKAIEECRYLLHHDYTFSPDFFTTAGYDSIDTIVHAGAFIPKNASNIDDFRACNRNIQSTAALLTADLAQLRKFVFISSVDVYGRNEIISEGLVPDPVSLYGQSKLYCERMIETWAHKRGINLQILRLGHVYGEGEEAYQKIIPLTFHRLRNNQRIEVWGSGEDLRSFIYVRDVVTAIVNAVELRESIGIVNVAGSERIAVKDLLNKLISISGIESKIERLASTGGRRNTVFDNSKMRKFLLEKETSLEEGLMAEWEYMKRLGK